MNTIGFQPASQVYECCSSNRIAIRSVEHNGARALSVELGQLRMELGETGSEQYWERILAPLYFYRFRLAAIPLAFNSPLMIPDGLLEVIQREIPISKSTAPRYYDQLARIGTHIEGLIASPDAPLLEALRSELTGSRDSDTDQQLPESRDSTDGKLICVVLKGRLDASLRNAVRAAVGKDKLEVVGISGLRSLGVADSLITIGNLGWFPEHFQTAPRSRHLISIRFSWTGNSPDPKPALLSTEPKEFASRWESVDRTESRQTGAAGIIDDDVLPSTNWGAVDKVMHGYLEGDSGEEKIQCKLLMLTNQCAVYVDNRADGDVDVVVTSGSKRRDRVATQDLEVGMFILLRTAGGGDLIEPMADQLLGKNAAAARARQARWKAALKALVAKVGDGIVIKELQALGCRRANRQNLYNWIGERSIRPEYDEDFLSILVLCSLDSEAQEFIENANRIDGAHKSAGFGIRRALLRRVEEIDLNQMISTGTIEIQLAVALGGNFTAYRIEDISPQDFLVPSNHVGHPQTIGARVWQG